MGAWLPCWRPPRSDTTTMSHRQREDRAACPAATVARSLVGAAPCAVAVTHSPGRPTTTQAGSKPLRAALTAQTQHHRQHHPRQSQVPAAPCAKGNSSPPRRPAAESAITAGLSPTATTQPTSRTRPHEHYLQPPTEKTPTMIRCDRCQRRLRNINAAAVNGWNCIARNGDIVGYVCSDC